MDLKSPNAVPHPGKGRLVEAFEVKTKRRPGSFEPGRRCVWGKGLTSRP